MSIRRPFSEVIGIVLGKGDIQSMLCLLVFCIVFFVLGNKRLYSLFVLFLIFFDQLTSRIPLKIPSERISLSFLFGSTSVASMTTLTTIQPQKNPQPATCLFEQVPSALTTTLSLLTIALLSILPIAPQFRYGLPNMFFTALGFLPSPQSSLWLKQIVHCKTNQTVPQFLILGLSALLENGGGEVSSRLGIRTLLLALATKKAGALVYSA